MLLDRFQLKGYSVTRNTDENIHASNNAIKVVETEHERIHSGKYFKHTDVHSVANGGNFTHYLIPNSGQTLHLRS